MSKAGDRALTPVAGVERGVSNLARTRLTAVEFQGLADVPPEAEWFANINNPQTRRAYRIDLREFYRSTSDAVESRFIVWL